MKGALLVLLCAAIAPRMATGKPSVDALRDLISEKGKPGGRKRLSFAESHGTDAGEAATQHDNGNGLTNHDNKAAPRNGADGDDTHDVERSFGRALESDKCEPHCDASCCYFSRPMQECGGCGEDIMCHPGAECYETGNKGQAKTAKTENEAGEVCQGWCLETSDCCDFSHPKGDCAGCDPATYGCAPGLECYETGLAGKKEDL